jgi:hypothetical protein
LPWSFPRALRFALRVPICFRTRAQNEWRQGRTENMSRSGVLFVADERLRAEEDVEMVFMLPVVGRERNAVVIACQGRVVRAEAPAEVPVRMAARFLTYQFLRAAAAEEA